MRFLPRKKQGPPSLEKSAEAQDRQAAKHAIVESQARLAETQADWPEVNRVTRSLADMREQNHFAAKIKAAIIGGVE